MNFNPDNVVGNIIGNKNVKPKNTQNTQPKHYIKDKDTRKNVNYAVGGGLLGAFVGAPGVGVALGLVAANKDKLEKFAKRFDEGIRGKK